VSAITTAAYNSNVTSKETIETKAAPAPRRPELDGADSMLRCYNAAAWRLEDWFDDDAPQPPLPPAAPPEPK
jgi:hypothetical protein